MNSGNFSSYAELLEWVAELQIQLEMLISMKADELQVLQLLYFYWHLNSMNLDSLPATDLIVHQVQLTSGTKSLLKRAQF